MKDIPAPLKRQFRSCSTVSWFSRTIYRFEEANGTCLLVLVDVRFRPKAAFCITLPFSEKQRTVFYS